MKKTILFAMLASSLLVCGCSKTVDDNNDTNPRISEEEYNKTIRKITELGYSITIDKKLENGKIICNQSVDFSRQNLADEREVITNIVRDTSSYYISDGIHWDVDTGEILEIYSDIRNYSGLFDLSVLFVPYKDLTYDSAENVFTAVKDDMNFKYVFINKVLNHITLKTEIEKYEISFHPFEEVNLDFVKADYQIKGLSQFQNFYEKTASYVKNRIFYKDEDFSYSTFKTQEYSPVDRTFSYHHLDEITNRSDEYYVDYDKDTSIAKERFTSGTINYHVPNSDGGRSIYSASGDYMYTNEKTPEAYMLERCADFYRSGFDEINPELNILEQNGFIDEFTCTANGVNSEGHLTIKPEHVSRINLNAIYFTTKLVDNRYILECDQYFSDGTKEAWICICTREANNNIVLPK